MTVIYLTEYKTRCYGVTLEINGCFEVQKIEDIPNHIENNIICVKPLEIFLGKCEVCDMMCMSVTFDKSVIDGNTS